MLVCWNLNLPLSSVLPAGTAGSCAAPLGRSGVCLVSLNQKVFRSSYSISDAA